MISANPIYKNHWLILCKNNTDIPNPAIPAEIKGKQQNVIPRAPRILATNPELNNPFFIC